MRVHRIALRDVKGVRECELVVPDAGVVVLEGPNEVGKSTVVEALDLLLDPRARATSKAARVRGLQPVGRDVGPYVEAELTLAGHRVRFGKQWLRQPRTELELLSPVHEVLAGDAAQQRFDALLEQGLDRQLWDALRFLQSGGPLVGGLGDSDALTRALDAAAGADLHSDQGEDLLSTVEAEYQRYFTPTGRPARELKEVVQAAQHARDAAVDRHRAVQEVERMSDRHEELSARLAAAQARRAELADDLDEAMAGADRAEEALRRLEHAEAAEREHGAAAARAEREVERRATAIARAERLADRTVRAAEELAEAEQQLGEQERELTAAQAVADGSRRDEEEVTERVAQAEADEERSRARQRWQAVVQALHADAQAVAELAELREQEQVARERLATLATATREMCEQARLLEQEIALLEEQAQESAARWRMETLAGELAVTVAGEPVTVTEAAPAERVIDTDTVVEMAGTLRMVLQAGRSERARATRVEEARCRLADLLQQAGVDTVGRLVDAAAERQRVTEELDRLQRRAAALSAGPVLGQERRDELEREAAALERELGDALGADDVPDPAQALGLVRAARSEERRLRRARQEAEAALGEVARRRSSLELAVARGRTLLEQCTAQRDECLMELAEARAGHDDQALHAALDEARSAAREAHAQAEQARRRAVETGAAEAAGRLDRARERLEHHDRHVQELRGERDRLAGQLELVLGEGRQEELDRALADLEHARQELDSASRRARAVRHLRTTLLRHRESAQQAYARPYTAAVEALGREVYGEGFAVEVADDLHVVARVLDGVRVPVDQLSGGAREQLGVLCRLAVAGLVDQAEGVPVVLDDALGFTDPERLADIVRVLGAASSGAQVLLLTCVPDRVAGLDGATRVTLRPAS